MLDAEELELGVGTSFDAIRQHGDELEARSESGVSLTNLVDEGTLEVGNRKGKGTAPLGREAADMVLASKNIELAQARTMRGRVSVANQVRGVEGRVSTLR